jgi:hypothetical protein
MRERNFSSCCGRGACTYAVISGMFCGLAGRPGARPWIIATRDPKARVSRRYWSFILETTHTAATLVRIVLRLCGCVEFETELVIGKVAFFIAGSTDWVSLAVYGLDSRSAAKTSVGWQTRCATDSCIAILGCVSIRRRIRVFPDCGLGVLHLRLAFTRMRGALEKGASLVRTTLGSGIGSATVRPQRCDDLIARAPISNRRTWSTV